jgi:hypothetical protein
MLTFLICALLVILFVYSAAPIAAGIMTLANAKAPRKNVLGHTWVGWANFLLLRWFFIRVGWETIIFKNNRKPTIRCRWFTVARVPWKF